MILLKKKKNGFTFLNFYLSKQKLWKENTNSDGITDFPGLV